MFYHFLYPLHEVFFGFNVFRYITFRTIYAAVTALFICFLLGPWMIRKLEEMQLRQPIRKDGPSTHLTKKGTPTMGGILIIFAVVVSTILWTDLTVNYIWYILAVMVSFGIIGFLDDYWKLTRNDSRGVSPRIRLSAEFAIALAVSVALYFNAGFSTSIAVPFFKTYLPDPGAFYIVIATLAIVGTANAVNLTDGLDGLAIGPALTCFMTYLLFAYFAGHIKIADYLLIPHVAEAGELTIFCGAVVGAGIGFLWYNTYPAQVFMGDVGSLSLGGALGTLAIVTKQEILLIIVGGLFVMETLSVIFQVGWFKLSGGKRLFLMAPLHHHFELKGWSEPKVIVRFWIISILLAMLAISTLKLR